MIKGFYAENYASIPLAIARGVNRVELCNNLAVGGTTPSTGVVEKTLGYAGEKDIPVMTIIHPRGGDFVYNNVELKIMHTGLIEAKRLGTDDVIFGHLAPSGWLNEGALELLIEAAEGLQITFHMAFDSTPEDRQFETTNWLVEHSVDHILTHGGPADKTIVGNFPRPKELIAYTDSRLIILPGGGVAAESAAHIVRELNVNEVHRTKIADLQL